MLEHYQDSFKTEINKIYYGLEESLSNRTYYNYRRASPIPRADQQTTRDSTVYRLNVDSLLNELPEQLYAISDLIDLLKRLEKQLKTDIRQKVVPDKA